MAQLAKIEVTVLDASGNAISGASVEVRKQGAFVVSQTSDTVINVNDPGGIGVGDTVAVNTGTTTRSVSAVTETQITVGAPGFPGLSDDDRITVVTPLPLIYNDAQGAETASNPLTTGADGTVSWWMAVSRDVHVSSASITTKLYKDYSSIGENFTSNVFDSATAVAWELDTSRVLSTAGAKLLSVRNQNTEKASIDKDGDISGSDGIFSGTLAVTGASTFAALTATTGTFSSDVDQRRIFATQGTALVSGDFGLHGNWGVGATIGPNVNARDTRGGAQIITGASGLGANPTVTMTFKDGTYGVLPFVLVCGGTTNSTTVHNFKWIVSSVSATAAQFTFLDTPDASKTYEFRWVVIK